MKIIRPICRDLFCDTPLAGMSAPASSLKLFALQIKLHGMPDVSHLECHGDMTRHTGLAAAETGMHYEGRAVFCTPLLHSLTQATSVAAAEFAQKILNPNVRGMVTEQVSAPVPPRSVSGNESAATKSECILSLTFCSSLTRHIMHARVHTTTSLTFARSRSQPHIRLRLGSARSPRQLLRCLPCSRQVSRPRCQQSLVGSIRCSGVQTDSKAAQKQALPQLPALDGEHACIVTLSATARPPASHPQSCL